MLKIFFILTIITHVTIYPGKIAMYVISDQQWNDEILPKKISFNHPINGFTAIDVETNFFEEKYLHTIKKNLDQDSFFVYLPCRYNTFPTIFAFKKRILTLFTFMYDQKFYLCQNKNKQPLISSVKYHVQENTLRLETKDVEINSKTKEKINVFFKNYYYWQSNFQESVSFQQQFNIFDDNFLQKYEINNMLPQSNDNNINYNNIDLSQLSAQPRHEDTIKTISNTTQQTNSAYFSLFRSSDSLFPLWKNNYCPGAGPSSAAVELSYWIIENYLTRQECFKPKHPLNVVMIGAYSGEFETRLYRSLLHQSHIPLIKTIFYLEIKEVIAKIAIYTTFMIIMRNMNKKKYQDKNYPKTSQKKQKHQYQLQRHQDSLAHSNTTHQALLPTIAFFSKFQIGMLVLMFAPIFYYITRFFYKITCK